MLRGIGAECGDEPLAMDTGKKEKVKSVKTWGACDDVGAGCWLLGG